MDKASCLEISLKQSLSRSHTDTDKLTKQVTKWVKHVFVILSQFSQQQFFIFCVIFLVSLGRGVVYGCECVLSSADRRKHSFSTVIVVNNGAANIQVKVIIQRSDFTRDSAGSFLKNYIVI